jgi:hypothetical protein
LVRVLTVPAGPDTVKLLIVRLAAGVAALMVTVLVVALVMRMSACVLVGATPNDQLLAVCQTSLTVLVQRLVVCAVAVTPRAVLSAMVARNGYRGNVAYL